MQYKRLSRRGFLKTVGLTTAGVTLASACSKAAAPAATEVVESSAAAAAGEASGELAGEITIWDRSGDLFQVFDATIAEFNKKYPNIKVIHEAVDVNEKLPTTLAAGVNVPDGSFCEDVNIPQISEHLYDIGEWIKPHVDSLPPVKLRVNTTAEGKIVGVPYDIDPGLMFYRVDLLEQAGIGPESITTYDELLTAAGELKSALGNDDMQPIHIEQSPYLSQLWVEMFANQQGTSLVDIDGNCMVDSEPYLKIMNWIKNVMDAGLGNWTEYTSPGDIAALEADQVAFYPWAIWFNYACDNLLEKTKGKWRAMRLPAWDQGGARGGNMGGSSFVIPQKAKNPHLAYLFYEHLMLTPEGYKAVYGPNDIYPGGINTSLPANLDALDEQLFENTEGMGGQNLWEIAVAATKEIPGNYYYPTWYGQAVDIFAANVQRLIDGQMSPEEVLKQSQADIDSKLISRS